MPKYCPFPIKWFGDRNAYEKSRVRIITVALNPSGKEYVKDSNGKYLRFPAYDGTAASLPQAYNEYFDHHPYSWFNAFEHILNGMNASYFKNKGKEFIAIHTDICTPWGTDPTWSQLDKAEQGELIKDGFPEWEKLVKGLKPDIILFSIPNEYIAMLGIPLPLKPFVTFEKTKDGNIRKKPLVIQTGEYNGAECYFGKTWGVPFGGLGEKQKNDLGKKIAKIAKIAQAYGKQHGIKLP